MAKKKPNKRIQNKKQKQKVVKKLQNKGYSEKEIKRLPKEEKVKASKQVVQNDRKKSRREANKNYIRKNNLTETYKYKGKEYKGSKLADLSPEVLKEFAKIQKRRDADRKRQDAYKQDMLAGGLPEHLAEKYKGKSRKYVDEAIYKGDRTVYKAKESLSVLWSDVTGDSHYDLALADFNSLTTKEMISQIHNEYQHASEGKILNSKYRSTEKYFLGVAKIQVSSDREKLKGAATESYKKGYKQGAVGEDGHFLTSNKFTVRGYANMMLSVMTRAKPEHVKVYYEKFETFAYENLPEIHKQIFK